MISAPTTAGADSGLPSPAGGRALAGFLLSGFLLSLLGAILPAWGYHRDPARFVDVGNYFLSLALGIVSAAVLARRWTSRLRLARLPSVFPLVFSCSLSCLALAFLAVVSPPVSAWWRVAGLFFLGIGAGLLNTSLFQAMSGHYQFGVAGTVIRGGIWYGVGCLTATLLVAGTFYAYTVPVILAAMAAVPAVFAVVYARSSFDLRPPPSQPRLRQAFKDFRSPGAILFALVLFFQFGNEWSIAGWLPLFLIRRVGLSPKGALMTLALYWLFLLGGRLGAVAVLPHVRSGRLLLGSVASALFGCLILFSTSTGFGAASGVFFLGAGFVSIYPLLAEAIGRRFPYYHPSFFSGIFSVAVLGGLLAPATLGYVAQIWGVGVVIGIPLIGICLVLLLLPLIWLEAKVTGR